MWLSAVVLSTGLTARVVGWERIDFWRSYSPTVALAGAAGTFALIGSTAILTGAAGMELTGTAESGHPEVTSATAQSVGLVATRGTYAPGDGPTGLAVGGVAWLLSEVDAKISRVCMDWVKSLCDRHVVDAYTLVPADPAAPLGERNAQVKRLLRDALSRTGLTTEVRGQLAQGIALGYVTFKMRKPDLRTGACTDCRRRRVGRTR